MFDIAVAVSDRFPSLNPIALRACRMDEFCLMAGRLLDHERRRKRAEKRKGWRPAGDDWF